MDKFTNIIKYKFAAMLMIMYGGFMELDGISITIPVLLMGTDKYDIRQYSEFKLLYFLIKSIYYDCYT